MAVYKVAQDVEAEDKLLGPFSFRQFIYLIIVVIATALAWGLSRLFVPLAIIPLPIILFFGALALPLRKDQPMEIYLAAILSFYLKPRKRLWIPDGVEQLVEITAPKQVEVRRTKDLTQSEAEKRLSYLADIADTGGWSVRHAAAPQAAGPMISDVYFEAQQTVDVLDTGGTVAQSFDAMISESDARRKQEMIDRMHAPAPAPPAYMPPDPYKNLAQAPVAQTPTQDDVTALAYNPYPHNIHQTVIQPMSVQAEQAQQIESDDRARKQAGALARLQSPQSSDTSLAPELASIPEPVTEDSPASTSETQVSPDIINLASNTDLSIETIQREADRIRKKHEDDDEVFISLR